MIFLNRLKSFAIWVLYFVLPTDLYLRVNGYDPNGVGERFAAVAREKIND